LHIGLTPKRDKDRKPLMKGKDGKPLSDHDAQTEISVHMEFTIRPALLAVSGVANVSTYGEHPKLYRVLVKPMEMRAYGVTLDQIKIAVGKNIVYGSGGFHDTPTQRLPIEFLTHIENPEDLKRIQI